ncbi:response regulator transcription factor [Microbacterium sp. EYE_5]|uniref:response regulator n=1 Tax=unclassified Microbacterium TaxID=2609290 RepID=UPI0020067058|nr:MULTISPECIES: response regulator transcription factor [unclassified Microbacterium]MCK6079414.1 response regulator transcription factor [Microbacterium sp. EYE_382]MCK6084684.1 response regulator transcription factor [Microbacterium sp. EYE_384]MCK6123087.1 response regulator transcription factor [Microbacterium sp. EYE_80]MCK6125448.1 response regulator transcription factor [Microbacterium sp. EYE_79]MCK6140368.1 response regulator transcription factor [Microbacterium sp. EYE_39]
MSRILIVDDQPLIRAGLRGILGSAPDLTVTEVDNGYDAVAAAAANEVDLILMDIRMPGITGAEATRRIRELPDAHVRILVLTTFEGDETVLDAIAAGADGFLGKGVEPDELIGRIRSILAGNTELSSAAARALVRHVASPSRALRADPELTRLVELLTPRERDVVVAVAAGLRNDEIAAREFISQHTVKTHLNRAMTKLGMSDRAQVVSFAFRSGLVSE